MAKLDNPAGRLHELLLAFRREAGPLLSATDTWKAVLGTQGRSSTLLGMAEVAGLVPDIRAAVRRTDDEGQAATFARFSGKWLTAIMQPEHNVYAQGSGSIGVALDEDSLAVLGSMSSFLSLAGSEGVVPTGEVLTDLRAQARALIDLITDDEELPEDLKRLALDHAYRLAHALDHFRIGGPGAVLAARERLAGAMLTVPEQQRGEETAMGRVWAFSKRACSFMVKKAPDVAKAIESGQQIYDALPGGGS